MSRRKRRRSSDRENILLNCGAIHDDDLIDPKEFFRKKANLNRNKKDRKSLQLCRQIEQSLQLILGDCNPESLVASMSVISVAPAPDAKRLLVTVVVDVDPEDYDHQAALNDLELQKDRLRSEVARTIHRKRAPLLIYSLMGPADSMTRYRPDNDPEKKVEDDEQ